MTNNTPTTHKELQTNIRRPLLGFGYLFFIVHVFLFAACANGPDISDIKLHIELARSDKDLQLAAKDSTKLHRLRAEYGDFLEYYNVQIIGVGNSHTDLYLDMLRDFLSSPVVREAFSKTEEVFSQDEVLEKALTEGFTYMRYYFPSMRLPKKVVSYVSGFNEALMLTDSVIGIGLDRFLGDTCKVYDELNFPKYQRLNMLPDRIPLLVLQVWIESEIDAPSDGNLLDEMIYNGKLLYATKQCFPKVDDSLLMAFSSEQMLWCKEHEADMWKLLLEQELLFVNNAFVIQKYIGDAPYTAAFSTDSPGRACQWIGYRIVEEYVKRSGLSLPELMTQTASSIVKEARYNP